MQSNVVTRFVIPEVVVSHFHLHEGDVVADFGAGVGYFIPTLSRLVGSDGRVVACEIQKNLVEKVGTMVRQNGLSNVQALWCDFEVKNGISLKDDSINVGVLVNTFFQIDDKATAIAEFRRVLLPGGVINVIDWSESYSGIGPAPDQVVDKKTTCDWFESEFFVLEREYPAGSHHYGLTFRLL